MWSVGDFSNAMTNAIYHMASPKLIRKSDGKVSFNGFWRNGDKQNVCIWLDKATWHDAKTGEGGGCKEFAKAAFNMGLADFMSRYGSITPESDPKKYVLKASKETSANDKSVQDLWVRLQQAKKLKDDLASEWLKKRGFDDPRKNIRSGYITLQQPDVALFDKHHQNFISHRTMISPQIVVPMRSPASIEVKNFFLRSIVNVPKEEKSRLLPNMGGWHEPDGTLRAFGFPSLIKESTHLILCEGMADYFAVEFLLSGHKNFLPIGASNADGLSKWAQWLAATGYKGRVTILHQLDADGPGVLSTKKIGPAKAVESLRCLLENNIPGRLFDWPFYLRHTSTHPSLINDIADSLSTDAAYKESGTDHLSQIFLLSLTENKGP